MDDVGAGARVAQGENISWVEGLAGLPDGPALAQQSTALVERIANDPSLDEDTRELAKAKTKAVAEGLANVRDRAGAPRTTHHAENPAPVAVVRKPGGGRARDQTCRLQSPGR